MSERAGPIELVRLRSDVDSEAQTSATFRIGFVARDGNVVGTCVKFLFPDSRSVLVHMDTETTSNLMRGLTEILARAGTVFERSNTNAVAVSFDLTNAEIGKVTVATAVRRFTLSNDDAHVAIRFVLRNEQHAEVRLTHAGANAWLAQMDTYIAELVSISDARGSLH